MARSVRHASIRRGAPKRYKWCGAQGEKTISLGTSLVVGDVFPLCNSLSDAEAQGDTTIERILLWMSIRRLLTTDIDALGFIVQVQEDDVTTAAPSSVVNPVDGINPQFTYGNRDILLMGLMPVPQTQRNGFTGALELNKQLMVHHVEFNGRRKLHRLNDAVNLWIANTDTDAVLAVHVVSRILLRY